MTELKKNTIRTSNDFNLDFINEIIEHGSGIFGGDFANTIRLCIQCGTCTGSCPSGRRTAFRTREIFRFSQLGLRSQILEHDDVWLCTTCYTCQERCPRGVKTTDLIRSIRNIAVKEGFMHKNHRAVAGYMIKTGHAVPINEEVKKLRKELDLSEIPPTTHLHGDSLVELQKLIKKLRFDELVGFSQGSK
ncbi:CoB--CoM heterodisulfide reductase subunit C [[Eubacterium] cellulosolvens]